MKKCSSLVWQFFDRIESNGRCVAIQCKLCDSEYKYFGNTTNLRVHLQNKHPIQWDLAQDGSLRTKQDDGDSTRTTPMKRKKYGSRSNKDKNARYSIVVDPINNNDNSGTTPMRTIEIQRVDVLENSEAENDINIAEDDEAALNIVRQMHGSDEEWLDEDVYQTLHETYEPKRRPKLKIKREIISPPRTSKSYYQRKPLKLEKAVVEDRKDEYSVFGEYVANKLRKFKTPRTRGNLQQLITTILWQAEYGMYDNANSVKRVLLCPVEEPEQEHTEQTVVHEEIVTDTSINKDNSQPGSVISEPIQ